jgi:Mce-associated membrane protein
MTTRQWDARAAAAARRRGPIQRRSVVRLRASSPDGGDMSVGRAGGPALRLVDPEAPTVPDEAVAPARRARTLPRPTLPRRTVPGRSGPAAGRPRWARRPSAPVILGVLLVGLLVALGVTGRQWYEHRQLSGAHAAALAAAKQTTLDFVSISASSVDRDLQRIAAGATGDFADEFNRGLPQVRAAVVENDVQSQGTILRTGLVSGDLDSAVVIVAIDATVKNKGTPAGRLSHYRIQVDLALDGDSGHWLVSRLQFVG